MEAHRLQCNSVHVHSVGPLLQEAREKGRDNKL